MVGIYKITNSKGGDCSKMRWRV